MKFLYFAYGMNTNSEMMFDDCNRLGSARLLNYSWEMLRFANVYADPGNHTYGILWEISADALHYLDHRECYPICYNRVSTDVEHEGVIKQAFVYTLTKRFRADYQQDGPSQHYVKMVTAGLLEDGLRINHNRIELI